jgi:hypothetical protein
VDAALSGLDTVAGSNAQRVKVAARVAAELVPARFRGRVRLDDTPTPVGVVDLPYQVPQKVGEVSVAFARVGGYLGAGLLLPWYSQVLAAEST